MTTSIVTIRDTREAIIRFDAEAQGDLKAVCFTITVRLQPSGAALLEMRGEGSFMSKYWHCVRHDGCMDERMYGGTATFTLMPHELAVIDGVVNKLRSKGDWDGKYAPGSDFTGHDITPADGFGRYTL